MSLTDLTTTRYPNGVTNVNVGILTDSLKHPDPLLYQEFLDDFNEYIPTAWTVTETGGDGTEETTGGAGGLIVLTTTAADDNLIQIQKAAASFLPVESFRTYMRCRFALSDATESDFCIGFATVSADATVLANSLDGIFFLKADGDTAISLYVRQDNSTGSIDIEVADLEDAEFIELGVCYDGGDRVYYEVNGAVQGYITVSSAVLPNAPGAPVISVKNGEAAAKTATVDYLWIAQER